MNILDNFKIMEKHGFIFPKYYFVKTKEECISKARDLGYPLVLKIVSNKILHKSDVGGVKTNIKNEEELSKAWDEMSYKLSSYPVKGYIIQKMSSKKIPILIGAKKDPQFGYLIILGLGGIYVEIFKDISARICPVSEQDVIEMVNELKSSKIFYGVRGSKGINFEKLKELVIKVCNFVSSENILELDLNPVLFDENGYDIVDVRF